MSNVSTRERFWVEYYAKVVEQGEPWLDYSNERVQTQTFGLALEAAGPLRAKSCLDIGCGRGDFCRVLTALHAESVTGVDIVPDLIAAHVRDEPHVRWLCGSLQDAAFVGQLGAHDVVFLLEVLQLMPVAGTLRAAWDRLLPGGRLVAMVPNANCPIVIRTRERLHANYAPPTLGELQAVLTGLPDVEHAAYRGLSFSHDQRVVPYDVGSWSPVGGWEAEPNRIQLVALKGTAAT